MNCRILALIILFIYSNINAQHSKIIDSLNSILKGTTVDSIKVDVLIKLYNKEKNSNIENAYSHISTAYNLAKKSGRQRDYISVQRTFADYYIINDKYDVAMKYCDSALTLALKKHLQFAPDIYNDMGHIYFRKGDYTSSIEMLLKALQVYETWKNTSGIIQCNANIAVIYYYKYTTSKNKSFLENALKHNKIALDLRTKLNDNIGLAASYNNIGLVYNALQQYDTAIFYYKKSFAIRAQQNDLRNGASVLNNIATQFLALGEDKNLQKLIDSAIYYQTQSLKYSRLLKDIGAVAGSQNNLGYMWLKKGNYLKSKAYQDSAYKVALEIGSLELMKNTSSGLYDAYFKLNDYKNALVYFKLSASYKDSIENEANNTAQLEMSTKYETEKKEKENELLKKDAALKDSEIEKQATVSKFLYGVIGLALLVIIIAAIAYNNKKRANRILSEQKTQIEEQKKEIIDSIKYARRIQNSLLPTEKYIERNLRELKK